MEEVIVTATYRDTRLMDTPITISAVTEAQIELKGIEDIQTLYQSIPVVLPNQFPDLQYSISKGYHASSGRRQLRCRFLHGQHADHR